MLLASAEQSTWNADEKAAAEFLHVAEDELLKATEKAQFADWAYDTNVTAYNSKKSGEAQVALDELCPSELRSVKSTRCMGLRRMGIFEPNDEPTANGMFERSGRVFLWLLTFRNFL